MCMCGRAGCECVGEGVCECSEGVSVQEEL